MAEVIRTERLVLRPARPGDAPAMHLVLSDPLATRWWSTPPHQSLEQTEAWIAGMIENDQHGLDRLIELDGEVIGKAGFWRAPEVGYILRPDRWGRGFAREALTAMLDRLFDTTEHAAATADVDPANTASLTLLERLGFARKGFKERTWFIGGEWKDSVYLALDRAVWAAQRKA